MTRSCQNCGTQVTPDFARVFGDNEGRVHGCLECMTGTDVREGIAAQEAGQ